MIQTDFLIIGSGIAGLAYSLKVSEQMPSATISILTKKEADDGNTKYAQGGIAVVGEEPDSFEKHINDTLISGDGLCIEEIVRMVISEGPERVKEMIEWGTNFDKDEQGNYLKGKEGGHSEFRILHHKDITGWEIQRALLQKVIENPKIKIYKNYFVIDLITQHHLGQLVLKSTNNIECYGVYALNTTTNEIEKVLSKITLLASGGCGQVYRATTNPTVATGDGIAMVYRAKGRIRNMEFIQFHPTALYEPGVSPSFLITEAVRGDGGILRNKKGEAFMQKYDTRLDLAPRDIVARAIDKEMKMDGTEYVYLDCRHMDKEKFIHHFPTIYEKCKSIGINVFTDMIPVSPAAHYCCGGVWCDEYGRTSIRHLYVSGECSSTGLHGANRLASNSLLEALIFSHRSAMDAIQNMHSISFNEEIPEWNAHGTTEPEEMILITQSLKELKSIMSDYVGIVRNNVRLERAMARLDLLHSETEEFYRTTTYSPQLGELRNLITIGYLIVKSAQFRKESRGLHYNTDYPEKNPKAMDIIL